VWSRGISGGECAARLEARDDCEKADHFISAQHTGELARLAGIGDPLRDRVAAERQPIEEAQSTDNLIERRPG